MFEELLSFAPTLGGLSVLLILSAFFSCSETALFSLSRLEIEKFSTGEKGERIAAKLLANPKKLLGCILIGNLSVNILIPSLIASIAIKAGATSGYGMFITILVSSILLLLFGEMTPKALAMRHASGIARFVSRPLLIVSHILRPILWILQRITDLLLYIFHLEAKELSSSERVKELTDMLTAGEVTGATNEKERILINNIISIDKMAAHEIMIHRTDTHGIDDQLTLQEAFQEMAKLRYSRMPVYHEDLDDSWCMISLVDYNRWKSTPLMKKRLCEFRNGVELLTEHDNKLPLYPVIIFPEPAKIEQMLSEMRNKRIQFAIIVDEYGGTAGVLTMKDILGSVLGSLSVGSDDMKKTTFQDNKVMLLDGWTHIRQVNYMLPHKIQSVDADTIGGYVMELLGRLPRSRDIITDQYYQFKILKMAGRKVGSLKLSIINKEKLS